ncbi:restriction endonuclease [Candidatus Acetothermia bacterium]|nr:restriction endonuclease [Candidatus Acetothermia bacterium]
MKTSILDRWGIKPEELSEIIESNPSLRGLLMGYVAEYKFQKLYLQDKRIENIFKPDSHDRTEKGDWVITYKGVEISIQVKSLQTNTIEKSQGQYSAKFQCDASDRRKVTLPNGQSLETTCLLVGEFDLLAVNLYGFREKWKFAFAKNRDLPRSRYKKYTSEQPQFLIATNIAIALPLQPPFEAEPFRLLDAIVECKKSR